MTARPSRPAPAALLVALTLSLAAHADEGMWPLNQVDLAAIAKKHGKAPTAATLQRAMHASVRFNSGGSGSFVSRDGLVLTNHHVAADCIAKLGQEPGAPDYTNVGFVARAQDEEKRCPDLELNVLRSIEDVTARVEGAATGAADDAEKNKLRKGEMARIEKACVDALAPAQSGRCDVVTLYGGGAYHLYTYRKYVDVRLAWAPEASIAFFGGDPENFTFPRADLDAALFRVYEQDRPLKVSEYLPLSARGPREGEPVFVTGHPGSTDRFTVLAKLELLRDVQYPATLASNARLRDVLKAYAKKGEREERAAHKDIFSLENSLKAIGGYQAGLLDVALMGEAKRRQDELVARLNALPADKLAPSEKERLIEAWPKLEKAYRNARAYAVARSAFDGGLGPSGRLWSIAKTLVRMADELPKKSEERLREYRDSNLASVELGLFSSASIEPSYEVERLAFGLDALAAQSGAEPSVKSAFAGKSARARAEQCVSGTKLADVALRKQIVERIKKGEGKAALDELRDPLIDAVRALDGKARELRKKYEDEVEGAEKSYNGRIAEAYAHVYGAGVYPDATFTLRLSTGSVRSYVENGKIVRWSTGFGDLYAKSKRNGDREPYRLPPKWHAAMPQMDFSLPFNFVSTNDIIGGNSGSPVWNVDGDVVGLIFDGNIQSLPNRFVYREDQARAVSVASNAILHALDRVYGAKHIEDELLAERDR